MDRVIAHDIDGGVVVCVQQRFPPWWTVESVARLVDTLGNEYCAGIRVLFWSIWEEVHAELEHQYLTLIHKSAKGPENPENEERTDAVIAEEIGLRGGGWIHQIVNGNAGKEKRDRFVARFGRGIREPSARDRVVETAIRLMRDMDEKERTQLQGSGEVPTLRCALTREVYEWVSRLLPMKAWEAALETGKNEEVASVIAMVVAGVAEAVPAATKTTQEEILRFGEEWGTVFFVLWQELEEFVIDVRAQEVASD